MDRKLDWDVDVEGAVDMMDREEENIDNIGPVLQQLNSGFKTGPQPNYMVQFRKRPVCRFLARGLTNLETTAQ